MIEFYCRNKTKEGYDLKLEGAIFDLDGTLVDSMPMWRKVGTVFLESRQIEPEKNFMEKFRTMSLMETAHYFRENYGVTDEPEAIVKEFEDIVFKDYENTIPLKDGVLDMLKEFKSKNIKMIIATATNRHLVLPLIKRLELEDYFDGLITCKEAGRGKDSPIIYQKALELIGVKKENSAVFEDSLHAIKTAKKDGFFVVGVYDDESRERWDIIKERCDLSVTSYHSWLKEDCQNIL